MPIAFWCPCGTPLKVKDALAGKKVKCPKCGMSIAAPQPAAVDADDDIVEVRECPSCGESMDSAAVICIGCGHDFRPARDKSKKSRKARKEQSAGDLVESVLGYSGKTSKKKKRGKSGPSEQNWKSCRHRGRHRLCHHQCPARRI
ncbi:MAG: hypothetical protein FJ271_27380 [Planctomycetes bacterium]|nr:hypothetical protein [Planctomycetota bacterium]